MPRALGPGRGALRGAPFVTMCNVIHTGLVNYFVVTIYYILRYNLLHVV